MLARRRVAHRCGVAACVARERPHRTARAPTRRRGLRGRGTLKRTSWRRRPTGTRYCEPSWPSRTGRSSKPSCSPNVSVTASTRRPTRCSPPSTSRRMPTPASSSSVRTHTTVRGRPTGCASPCRDGVALPPSLVNIYKELNDDFGDSDAAARQPRAVGSAGRAAAQHDADRAGRHCRIAPGQGLGDVHRRGDPRRQRQGAPGRVHSLGNPRSPQEGVARSARQVVIESAHPSPLSAHNGFFGSRPFSRTNDALEQAGLAPIDWRL